MTDGFLFGFMACAMASIGLDMYEDWKRRHPDDD